MNKLCKALEIRQETRLFQFYHPMGTNDVKYSGLSEYAEFDSIIGFHPYYGKIETPVIYPSFQNGYLLSPHVSIRGVSFGTTVHMPLESFH